MNALTFGLLPNIGTWEMLLILAIGLLLFGRRLPEVGRSLGKGIVEFKKGLKGIEEDIEHQTTAPPAKSSESIRPPLTSGGEDARVSQGQPIEQAAAKPAE